MSGATLVSWFLVVAPAYPSGAAWTVGSSSYPTNFAPGDETGDDTYVIRAIDTGARSAGGGRIEVADTLPPGLTATSISGEDLGNGQALTCKPTPTPGCTYEGYEVSPGDVLQVTVAVHVKSDVVSPAVNLVTITGGGAAATATSTDPTTISSTPARFGVSGFAASWSDNSAGAGVNLTAGFALNEVAANGEYQPASLPKDVEVKLPPGVFANATALPHCSLTQVYSGSCGAQTAVGVVFASLNSAVGGPPTPSSAFLYSVNPASGETAAFMFKLGGGEVRVDASISTEDRYRMHLHVENIPQTAGLLAMEMTLWGVPGAYNDFGAGPDHVLSEAEHDFGSPGTGGTTRFLTDGGSCESQASTSTLSADSWLEPSVFVEASSTAPPLTGCNRLSFDPSLAVVPDISQADEPSAYELDLRSPSHEEPEGLAGADLREATVTLPESVGISLSAGNGAEACSEAQVGLASRTPVRCPDASKVGQVRLTTPLVGNPLEGAVYLATQNENPFGSLLAMYIVAEDPVAGVLIKLAAQVEANPETGRLTIVLRELPQLPISDLELHFFGGSRALLSTPYSCGLATTTSVLTPWSGNAPVSAASSFEINSGANGTPCSDPQPFSPAFRVTSTINEAGAYDSLTLLVTRTDQEAGLGQIAVKTPQAVQEMFTGVPPCNEPQAAQDRCPAASRIGSVAAAAGLNSDPAYLSGNVYLTGPYRGAQQGLSIVLPVSAGPFQLGTVVIRASEQIDPGTGQMSITSDQLPKILAGIPLQLKTLGLQLDRGEFRLDPEGCEPHTITGVLTSMGGSSVPVSVDPFSADSQGTSSQCDVPRTPAVSASAASGASPGAAHASLLSVRITTTSRGKATVKLICTGAGTCRGKLTLTVERKDKRGKKRRSKTTIIGTAAFSIRPGKTAAIKLMLNGSGRALLSADHGRLDATLTILQSSSGRSQRYTKSVHLVQRTTKAKPARTPVRLTSN